VVVDDAGDVFIADASHEQVVKVQRSQPPTLSWAAAIEGSLKAAGTS